MSPCHDKKPHEVKAFRSTVWDYPVFERHFCPSVTPTAVLSPCSSHSCWCQSLEIHLHSLVSISVHHTEHLISGMALWAHTCSTNQSQKSTLSVVRRRCWGSCVPVPSGVGASVTASHHPSSSKNSSECVFLPSVLQGWVLWRTGPGATTTTSASTAPTASMADVSSCVCSSWLLWRTTPPSTTSRCSAGERARSPLSIFIPSI